MINKLQFLVPLMILLVLSGCHRLEEGLVIEKEYQPTRTYTIMQPMRIGKVTMLVPHRVTDYEDWVLTVEGAYGAEIIHEHIYVSNACF